MAASRCAVCGRAVVGGSHSFCSRRCAEVDLGRWLSGQYVLPGGPAQEEDADGEGAFPPDRPLSAAA